MYYMKKIPFYLLLSFLSGAVNADGLAQEIVPEEIKKIKLGCGYNPDTGNQFCPSGYSYRKFMNEYGESTLNTGVIQGKEWAKYVESSSEQANQSNHALSVAGQAGYGFFKASLQFDLNSMAESVAKEASSYKMGGLIRSYSVELPAKAGILDPQPIQIEDTRDALENFDPKLQQDINNVYKAITKEERDQAIVRFYARHGTHVITKIEKSQLAGGTISAIAKANNHSEARAINSSISVGYLMNSLNAGYKGSQMSKLSTEEKALTMNYWSLPYDPALIATVKSLLSELNSELLNQTGLFDLNRVQQQDWTSISSNLTGLTLPVTVPDQAELEAHKQRKANISKARTIMAELERKLQTIKRDYDLSNLNTTQKDEIKTKTNDIYTLIDNEFYSSSGEFGMSSLKVSDQERLAMIYREAKILHDNVGMPYDHIQTLINDFDNLNSADAARARQANADLNNQGFISYLKKVHRMTTGSTSGFDTWLRDLPLDELNEHHRSWEAQYSTADASSQSNTSRKMQTMSFMANEVNDMTIEGVTTNFDIMPWSQIYPILEQAKLDSYHLLAKLKVYNHVQKYIDILNYLEFLNDLYTKTRNYTDRLGDLYIQYMSVGGVEKAIEKFKKYKVQVINSIMDGNLLIGGVKVEAFQKEVDSKARLIDALNPEKNWFQIVSKLYDRGWLNTYGVAFYSSSNFQNRRLLARQDLKPYGAGYGWEAVSYSLKETGSIVSDINNAYSVCDKFKLQSGACANLYLSDDDSDKLKFGLPGIETYLILVNEKTKAVRRYDGADHLMLTGFDLYTTKTYHGEGVAGGGVYPGLDQFTDQVNGFYAYDSKTFPFLMHAGSRTAPSPEGNEKSYMSIALMDDPTNRSDGETDICNYEQSGGINQCRVYNYDIPDSSYEGVRVDGYKYHEDGRHSGSLYVVSPQLERYLSYYNEEVVFNTSYKQDLTDPVIKTIMRLADV